MKKCLKFLTFTLCCLVSAFVCCACTNNTDGKVPVELILVDKASVNLVLDEDNQQSSKQEIVISYEPANSTQIDIQFFQYDESLIEITPKQKTGDTFIISAKDFEGTKKQTTIGIRMKGNVDVQAKCQVTVEKKSLPKLQTPTNLKYNEETNRIEWDMTTHTVDEGFDGYTLKINNDEIYCNNNYYEFDSVGQQLNVQVKANSLLVDKDSEYSSNYAFKVLSSVQNLQHNNGTISWDTVSGATSYKYKVGVLNEQVVDANTTSFTYDFINKGQYVFEVRAMGEDEVDTDSQVTCYVFDSKPVQIEVTKLSSPENFVFDKLFYWDTPSATEKLPNGYELVEVLDESEQIITTTQSNHYSLLSNISVGTHTYKIRALGDGKTTISSDYSATKTIRKLATPTNLRVEDGKVTWDKDANAVSYHLIFMGMFDGKLYSSDFYNTDKSINSYFYIDQPTTEDNKVTFDFSGEKFTSDYVVKVASVSDAENTVDSEFTLPISVSKLEAPDITSFGLNENVLTWNANPNASKYNIELYSDSTVIETVFTNSYTIPDSILASEFSFKIIAVGDSTKKTLTSDKSKLAYASKLSAPVVYVQSGKLYWQIPDNQNFSAYVLSINDVEQNMQKLDEFDFADYEAGPYIVKVKALGGNASKQNNKYIVGTCSSDFSSELSVVKYSAPVLKLENGEVTYTSANPEGGKVIGSSRAINSTQIEYTARVYGQDGEHITSDASNAIVVTTSKAPSNLSMENGVLNWDELNADYSGAYFQLEISFESSDPEVESKSEVLDMGTAHSKNFALDTYLSGIYSARVRIVGTTSGVDENLVATSSYSNTFVFYKLPKPVLTATSALSNSSLKIDSTLGLISWDPAKVGSINAMGYNLKTEKGSNIANIDVKNATSYKLSTEAGTYKISIEAYGNGKQIISSGYSEQIEFVKLKKATNLSVDNEGKISWSSDYNKPNDGLTSLVTNFPKNLRVVYGIEVNGELFAPYDFETIMNQGLNESAFAMVNDVHSVNFNEIRQLNLNAKDPIKFSNGTYQIRILTLPINIYQENVNNLGFPWGYTTDLVSDYSDYITLTKLEIPHGLRMDCEIDNDNAESNYILSWTKSLDTNVTGYEILIKEAGKEDSEGEIIQVGTNTSYNFTQDYLNAHSIVGGSYIAKVRCITNKNNYIYSDYCNELSIEILENMSLSIANGILSWAKNPNAVSYKFIFKKDGQEFTEILDGKLSEYALTLANNERFTAGEYEIQVQVVGNASSNYNNKIYLSALNPTDAKTFTKLATPTNLHVSEGKIAFDCGNSPEYFQLLVKQGSKTTKENILTQKVYELSDKFKAGNYSLNVQAMGGTTYLNSEISDTINPQTVVKLENPTPYLKNGILSWNYINNANTYQLKISGERFDYEVKMPEGTTSFDISGSLTTTDNQTVTLSAGTYSIQIKSIGTNKTYLNSDYSSVKTFRKLATPSNVQISDGKLTWNQVTSSDAPNGISLFIKRSGTNIYDDPIVLKNSENSFDFAGSKYPAGTYSVYLQTIGDTQNNFTSGVGNVCGTPTEVKIIEKAPVPTNAKIEYVSDKTLLGKYTFDALNNASYENPKYLLNITISIGEQVVELTKTLTSENKNGDCIEFNIPKEIENYELFSGTKLEFKVKVLGEGVLINSEFNDTLSVIIPETPTLEVVLDQTNNFTGKVQWNEIKVGDNICKYVLKYQYIDLTTANTLGIKNVNEITETHWANVAKQEKETENLFAYVTQKGYYRFSVNSVLVIDANTTEISSGSSNYSSAYNYNLFSSGIGISTDPFIVDSVQSFNFIRYNLTAHYKLSTDIDFTNKTIQTIGSEQEKFTGSFDGNGKMLYNISISGSAENSSIFNYVGSLGVIKNVIIKNISITDGSNVGGIVGKNEGIIQNVKVGATSNGTTYSYDGVSSISPYATTDQYYSRVGGICGYNFGTIVNCENYAIIAPRNDYAEVRTGGIVGENSGTIEYCYNYNNVGGTGVNANQIYSNMSGGICGFNQAEISYCGNFGNIYAQSRNANRISQGAYAGGVCAYNNRGLIKYCFNDNSNQTYTSDDTISASTQIYGLTTINLDVFVGGLVAYNSSNAEFQNGYSISNIQYNLSGTSAYANVGTLVGDNDHSYMDIESGYRVYVLSGSMTQNVGNNLIGENIITFTQGINNFKDAVAGSFNLIIGETKFKEISKLYEEN